MLDFFFSLMPTVAHFSALNVLGLAIAMAAIFLLMLTRMTEFGVAAFCVLAYTLSPMLLSHFI